MVKKRVIRKSTKKTTLKTRRAKGGWSIPLLGIGKKKDEGQSTALVPYKSNAPSTRVLKRRPTEKPRTTIFSSSGKPSTTSSSGISFTTYGDTGSPSTGSKEYKKQLKLQQKREKAERDAIKKEEKRQARMARDIKDYEVHSASAKKFESLARERRAKDLSRRRSTVAHVGRTLYNIVSPYNKKPRRKYRKSSW